MEQDHVVAELDVIYHTDLNGRVYLLQYPMRPWHRGPEDPVLVDARPSRCMLEMEVAIPTDGPHFDSRAASDPVCARMRHKATEVPLKAIHAVGVVQGNEVHLTPIHSVQQFRPDMSYLDEATAGADESKPVAQAVRIQTQFRRADEKASAARRNSYAYLKQYQEDEPWVRMRPHAISSDRATDVLNLLSGYASDGDRLKSLLQERHGGALSRELRAIVEDVKVQARRLAEKRSHRSSKAAKAIEELAALMGGQVRGTEQAAELAKFAAAAKDGVTDATGLVEPSTAEKARELLEIFKKTRRNTMEDDSEDTAVAAAAAASSSSSRAAATSSGGTVASNSGGAGQRRARSATDSGSTLSGGVRIPPSLYVRVATGEPLAMGPNGRPLPLQGLAGGSLAARRKAAAAAAATAAAAAASAAAAAASSSAGTAMLSAVAAPVTSNVPPSVAMPGHSAVHAPGQGPIIPTGVPIGTILSYPGDHANTYKSASKPKPVGQGVANMAHPLPLQDMADFPVALQVEEILRRAGPITFRQLLAAIKVPASPLDVLGMALRAARLIRGCFVIKSELALAVHWSARLGPTVVATARAIGCTLPETVSATVEVVNSSGCPALGTILSASAAALAAVQQPAQAVEGSGARVSLAAQSQAAAMAKAAANQVSSLLATRAGGRHPRALPEDAERRMIAVRDLVLCSFAQTPVVRAADLAARTGVSQRLLTAILTPLAECVEHRHGGLWRFKVADQTEFCAAFPLLAASAEAWVAQRTEELAILTPPRDEPPLPEYVTPESREAADPAARAAVGPADAGRRYVWAPTDARPTGAPTSFAVPAAEADSWEARLLAEAVALPEDSKLATEMLRELMARTDGGKLKKLAHAMKPDHHLGGGGGGAMKPDLGGGIGGDGEVAGGGARSVSFGAVATHNLSTAPLPQLPRTELAARCRSGLDTRLVKALRDVVWKFVKDNGVVSRRGLAAYLIEIADSSTLKEVAAHVRSVAAPGAAVPPTGDATAIDRAAFARHPMLPRALTELAEHVSCDQLSYVPDGTNSRIILASVGQSIDRYRNIVVRLLANAAAGGAGLGVKKKDIHDAVKQSTGEDLTPNAYQKITSELASSSNQVWVLKSGEPAPDAPQPPFMPALPLPPVAATL